MNAIAGIILTVVGIVVVGIAVAYFSAVAVFWNAENDNLDPYA